MLDQVNQDTAQRGQHQRECLRQNNVAVHVNPGKTQALTRLALPFGHGNDGTTNDLCSKRTLVKGQAKHAGPFPGYTQHGSNDEIENQHLNQDRRVAYDFNVGPSQGRANDSA